MVGRVERKVAVVRMLNPTYHKNYSLLKEYVGEQITLLPAASPEATTSATLAQVKDLLKVGNDTQASNMMQNITRMEIEQESKREQFIIDNIVYQAITFGGMKTLYELAKKISPILSQEQFRELLNLHPTLKNPDLITTPKYLNLYMSIHDEKETQSAFMQRLQKMQSGGIALTSEMMRMLENAKRLHVEKKAPFDGTLEKR